MNSLLLLFNSTLRTKYTRHTLLYPPPPDQNGFEKFNDRIAYLKLEESSRMNYFNVAIVGDACVGKSKFCDMTKMDLKCVMNSKNKFDHFENVEFVSKSYTPTILRNSNIMGPYKKNDADMNLMFHEISGAERFKQFRAGFYGDVDAFVVVHKGNSDAWIDEIRMSRPDAEIMSVNMDEMTTQRDAYMWMTERFGKCVDYAERPEFLL